LRILISGSHGLIGSALVPRLAANGDQVIRLVRQPPADATAVAWDPGTGSLDPASLEGFDAVINLAGEGIGDHRWSAAHKRRVLESRVQATTLLASALTTLRHRPTVLLSASAVGFYGDRGDQPVSEADRPGTDFLADVCRQWEAACEPASQAGVRTVLLRSGVVLSPRGGALRKQLPLFRAGLGGKLGSGRQYMSWISIDDEVAAIQMALTDADLDGPVNLTAPNPVTNADFTTTLARVLHRPAVARVPRAALAVVFGGQMADEMLLASARVFPRRLEAAGFAFSHPELPVALSLLLRP